MPVAFRWVQKRRISSLLLSSLIILMLTFGADSSSVDEPHPHSGVLVPFEAGDPKIQLNSQAMNVLASGKPYETKVKSESGNSGRGLVVQDVHAPTTIVWDRVLDFNNYSKMVPKTLESKNYAVEKLRNGQQLIYTRMKVGFPMLKLEFFVKHDYQPSKNSLTWTLDYSKRSDFDDSCGYWYIIPHPENPTQWTRVYYSVEVSMFSWVPKFVVDFMSSKALTDATAWVKKYSELEYAKTTTAAAASETQGQDDEVPVQKKKRAPIDWFQRKRRKQNKEDKKLQDSSSSSSNSDDGSDLSTCPSTDSEGECTAPLIEPEKDAPVGVVRVVLLTTVCGLTLFNVHLYFSQ